MELYIGFIISFLFAGALAFVWVGGIEYMHKNYPDYKGEDFLNWGDESAPWETKDQSDENKTNIENKK